MRHRDSLPMEVSSDYLSSDKTGFRVIRWRVGATAELVGGSSVYGSGGAAMVYGRGNGGARLRLAIIRLEEEEKVVMASMAARRWEGYDGEEEREWRYAGEIVS
ncbi:hypothetical protein RHMOL_Rhmol08G0164800 [Rhododendron molle]|uniref:Uncharacterized protein n=1 Tax=Rhododendron molle TaxID=49168 RepID=A0ACC0MPR3_RHOML|nr:hypothetical protein RHMOL_Rhmol08G0164800 [Rhododendron molle]